MKLLLELLFLSLLTGLWLALEEVRCQNLDKGVSTTSLCYSASSGKICFTTFLTNNNQPMRKPFKNASHWCKVYVPGSSLIIIKSQESERTVERFMERRELANETIFMDAQKLSTGVSLDCAQSLTDENEACVEWNNGQSLAACNAHAWIKYRYICKYSVEPLTDGISVNSHRQNNKSYIASEALATWYDARNECLRLGGDLASITDLRTIQNWSQLGKNTYWIGPHRNKWIWNSTGAELTYTDWENGSPEEFSDKQCICLNPQCRRENERTTCEAEYNRKWTICYCYHSYAIVCQKEEENSDFKSSSSFDVNATTKFQRNSSSSLSSSSTKTITSTSTKRNIRKYITFKATATSIRPTPLPTATNSTMTTTITTRSTIPTIPTTTAITTTTTSGKSVIPTVATYTLPITATRITGKSTSTSSVTQEPLLRLSEDQTTDFASSASTGLLKSFTKTEFLLGLLFFVPVLFIVFVVIVVIRKRKIAGRNEESPLKKTDQKEAVSPEYEIIVRNKRLPGDAVPIYTKLELTQNKTGQKAAVSTEYATMIPDKRRSDDAVHIYTELELIQKLTPSTIASYINRQPTGQAADKDITVVYADPHEI